MAEQTVNSEFKVPPEQELRRHEAEPKGVIRKNLKVLPSFSAYLDWLRLQRSSAPPARRPLRNCRQRSMSRPSRPFRTVRTTMSRISRTSLRPNGKRKHRRLRLQRRKCRRPRCRMARWRNRQQPRPMGRPDSRRYARLANLARNNRTLMCSSFLRNSNKRSSSQPRNENLLTMRASHPILSTHARRMGRPPHLPIRLPTPIRAHCQPRIRRRPASRRATWLQLVRPHSRRAIRPTSLLPSETPRSISTQLKASRT